MLERHADVARDLPIVVGDITQCISDIGEIGNVVEVPCCIVVLLLRLLRPRFTWNDNRSTFEPMLQILEAITVLGIIADDLDLQPFAITLFGIMRPD